jgi:serine phosphatase RsbU (regulator of sigma subunit)
MSEGSPDLRSGYAKAFDRYAQDLDEADLRSAYEVGREAVRRQLNVLEFASIHHEALSTALVRTSTKAEIAQLTRAAADFLCEALSAFEMVRRGYEEIRETALVEKQHADQLRQLADAFIEINSTPSKASLLENATRRAREIVGASCCVATIRAGDGTRDALWIAAAPGSKRGWRDLLHSPEASQLASLISSPRSADRPTIVDRRPQRGRLALDDGQLGWLGVALVSSGDRSLGSLQLFDEGKDRFSDIDQSILVQLAQMAAVALDNVQLYEREHRTVVTLQRALLPERLPQPAQLTVAARYIPGEAGLNVGGDWYDIAELSGNRVAIAMGDVVGRGARAASVMGRVRTGWRAYALRDDSPNVVMESLNALIEDLDPDHFSTMVHVLADPDEHRLRIVNAGHPPPLLVFPNGRTRYVREGLSIPLGVLPSAGYRDETVGLEGGSIVVLYTDGLIERPDASLDDGFSRLQRSVGGPAADAEALCGRILDRMLPNEAADDVALLAVQFGRAVDPQGAASS